MNQHKMEMLVVVLFFFKKMLLKETVKEEHCFCGHTGFLVDDVVGYFILLFTVVKYRPMI